MQYKKFEKEEIEAIAEYKRLKKMKKYQLKHNDKNGIDWIVLECDKISEIFEKIYVEGYSANFIDNLSVWMDGKVLE